MTIRKAQLRDVPAIFEMISHYAAEKIMLARPVADLYEAIREFSVAVDDDEVVGCGALKLYSPELAEIRSLCVAPGIQKKGVGRGLMECLLDESGRFGLKTVFALTLAPEFFLKCGFREAVRERFPMKIWRDCLRCDRYFRCNEKTVSLDLADRLQPVNENAESATEVSV
ncbi:MAG TPA: N-acetyltransferase [Terriglobia bacterium]|nr:N-acetyltransferase [Terriglobia bacterium]